MAMAYRVEDRSGKLPSWSQIAMCELDSDWSPKPETNRIVELPCPYPGTNLFEDPRIYPMEGGGIKLTFIAARFNGRQHVAAQGIALVDPDFKIVSDIRYPGMGNNANHATCGNHNLAGEKNWTLLDDEYIYSINPIRVYNQDGKQIYGSLAQFDWPYGAMSGSTPMISWGDNLYLGCFHSFIITGCHRQYHAGWYIFDREHGRMTHFSKEPFLSGYIDEDEKRPQGSGWTPRAVFPCGLIRDKDEIVLSYGWLDSTCRLGFFSVEEITDSLKPVEKWKLERLVINDPWGGIPGKYKGIIKGKAIDCTSWPKAQQWAKANKLTEQDLHDYFCKKIPTNYVRREWVDEPESSLVTI